MYKSRIVSDKHFILILRVSDLKGSKCVNNVVCIDCVGLRYVFILFGSLELNRKAAKKGSSTIKVLKMYSNKMYNQNCSYYECPRSLIRLTKGTVIIQPSQILHLLNLHWKLRLLLYKYNVHCNSFTFCARSVFNKLNEDQGDSRY